MTDDKWSTDNKPLQSPNLLHLASSQSSIIFPDKSVKLLITAIGKDSKKIVLVLTLSIPITRNLYPCRCMGWLALNSKPSSMMISSTTSFNATCRRWVHSQNCLSHCSCTVSLLQNVASCQTQHCLGLHSVSQGTSQQLTNGLSQQHTNSRYTACSSLINCHTLK